jgi:hypothetical protein
LAAAQSATGHFEVYCDGVGFFLEKVDSAPPPRKLLLFLRTSFPGIPHVPKAQWKEVAVFRNGCIADGECEVLARGRVWLDDEATRDARRVSGKYEIELNGQSLRGQFAAKRRYYRGDPPRICM